MGKVTEKLLKDFNDPIFNSSYEIYSPKRKISTKSKKMKQLKIICPNCNETFLADEVLQKYLKEKKKTI